MDKFIQWTKEKPIIAYPVLGIGCLVMLCVLMNLLSPAPKKIDGKNNNTKNEASLVEEGVDERAYVKRLEKQYFELEDRLKNMESKMDMIGKANKELKKSQKLIKEDINSGSQQWRKQIEAQLDALVNREPGQETKNVSTVELAVADIQPITPSDAQDVYLPLGSFCKGTLLTGVYAAADVNNPLPVLISLDEAFYGPNKSRIPLKNAFVMGKAFGDLVSQRALIQVIAISSVLPDGTTFEQEENLGYVTDELGELGIKGRVVYNSGRELALSFMGGFMSGGAQALADNDTVTTRTPEGYVSKEISGDVAHHAIFSGLSQSAGKLSDYYAKQAENLVPAVHIQNGATVYFIAQKGVKIHGLSRLSASDHAFVY